MGQKTLTLWSWIVHKRRKRTENQMGNCNLNYSHQSIVCLYFFLQFRLIFFCSLGRMFCAEVTIYVDVLNFIFDILCTNQFGKMPPTWNINCNKIYGNIRKCNSAVHTKWRITWDMIWKYRMANKHTQIGNSFESSFSNGKWFKCAIFDMLFPLIGVASLICLHQNKS